MKLKYAMALCILLIVSLDQVAATSGSWYEVYDNPFPSSCLDFFYHADTNSNSLVLYWLFTLVANRNLTFIGNWNITTFYDSYILGIHRVSRDGIHSTTGKIENLSVTRYSYEAYDSPPRINDAKWHSVQLQISWIDNCSFLSAGYLINDIRGWQLNETFFIHRANASATYQAWGPIDPPYPGTGPPIGDPISPIELEVITLVTVVLLILDIVGVIFYRSNRRRERKAKR